MCGPLLNLCRNPRHPTIRSQHMRMFTPRRLLRQRQYPLPCGMNDKTRQITWVASQTINFGLFEFLADKTWRTNLRASCNIRTIFVTILVDYRTSADHADGRAPVQSQTSGGPPPPELDFSEPEPIGRPSAPVQRDGRRLSDQPCLAPELERSEAGHIRYLVVGGGGVQTPADHQHKQSVPPGVCADTQTPASGQHVLKPLPGRWPHELLPPSGSERDPGYDQGQTRSGIRVPGRHKTAIGQSAPAPAAGQRYMFRQQPVRFSMSGTRERDEDYRCNHLLKPPYSFASLICMAMHEAPDQKVTLSGIYSWIADNFAYYRETNPTWQVRWSNGNFTESNASSIMWCNVM